MGVFKEFKEFLLKQNALALAIGVIIGAAIGKVVSGIVEDIFMPLIGVVMPGGEWREAAFHLSGQNSIKYGDLMGRIIDFMIVSAVVFVVVKLLIHEKKDAPAPTKVCPECLETVPAAAKRCRACTSQLS